MTSRTAAVVLPAAVGGLLAAATVFVAVVDPSRPGHFPPCPFLLVSGFYCPGCGGLRAVHALTRLDVGGALSFNPLFVAVAPFLVYLWAKWLSSAWRQRPLRTRLTAPVAVWSFVALALLFGVFRNTPYGAFLAP
ncbi:DUF2752 domain-containing protein [Herbidospora yilanensis]|uniref:DUF2752 domain-containing protein n=1 Tax=Herbidospora yilanensis TaxID=354426 RepID=UPI00078292BE|nr:DUF2752 domain-containing protein [Herbidospora yilanensis]